MKVFEVVMEIFPPSSNIEKEVVYATSDDDKMSKVTKHYEEHCEHYTKELISVRSVLTIAERISK